MKPAPYTPRRSEFRSEIEVYGLTHAAVMLVFCVLLLIVIGGFTGVIR